MNLGDSLLIVEDERLLSACLQRHLTALGVDVTVAGSVAEGRSRLGERSFDACLLDIGLPDGDGLSLLDSLSPERAVVITATPDMARLAAAGVRHVVPKPLDLDILTEKLFGLSSPIDRDAARVESQSAPTPTPGPKRPASKALAREEELALAARTKSGSGRANGLRIMLYSHDTVGLGHFRRNLTIARALCGLEPRPHVLMVSGATEAIRFPKPEGVDVITLPALAKVATSGYAARSLGVSLADMIALRSRTIHAAAESFSPDVVIVDNVPRGAEGELDVTLSHLRNANGTRIVLGLRDVLDEPAAVARDWGRLDNESAISAWYDEIWVYGDPAVVDLGDEYGFSAETRRKLRYVGYLDRKLANGDAEVAGGVADRGDPDMRAESDRYVLCLVGGGEDGHRLAEVFSRVAIPGASDLRRVLVLGPFMPSRERAELHRRAAETTGLEVVDFLEDPTRLIAGASAVVSMGGHNSVSEILSFARPALIVPRVEPRREQWIRAHRLARLGAVGVCEPDALCPEFLENWIETTLVQAVPPRIRVDMQGTRRVRELLEALFSERPGPTWSIQS